MPATSPAPGSSLVMLRIIYETHSTSTDNVAGIATGWFPGELSDTGKEQARLLGERRQSEAIATILTSDLRRAVQTAEIAFSGSGIPIVQDARLRECNYGEFNGSPVARVAALRARYVDQPFPGGQSYRDVVRQTEELLSELVARWDGSTLLIISHSANRWALDHLINGVPLEDLVDAPFDWQPGWLYTLP